MIQWIEAVMLTAAVGSSLHIYASTKEYLRNKRHCLFPKKTKVHVWPVESTQTGRSRRGVITYWMHKQKITIEGKDYFIKGASEDWLDNERTKLFDTMHVSYADSNLHKIDPASDAVCYFCLFTWSMVVVNFITKI